ncbi:hypothetical protein HAX54_049000, partial [Datura stramonium]|nr:hypothetical protein [Datura stramonium]
VKDIDSDSGIVVEEDIEQEVSAKPRKLVVADDINVDAEKSTSVEDGISGVKEK